MAQAEFLVCSEQPKLMRELLGEARRQADQLDWRIAALPFGEAAEDAAGLGEAGADIVLAIPGGQSETQPEAVLSTLSRAVQQVSAKVVLIGGTKLGLETAPRLVERMGAAYAPWATGFDITADSGAVTARCMLFAGAGLASYAFKPGPVVITAASNTFAASDRAGIAAVIETMAAETVTPSLKLIERKAKKTDATRLEEAKAIFDVGQGVKQKEDLALVSELANLFGGQLACSRPVASDRDWFPEWLGLSGKKVAPELCMTIGVSGAIQHIIGIRDSHWIVAVNSDEGAPIFTQADYGVVADLYEFLPVFIKKLKARGIHPAWNA